MRDILGAFTYSACPMKVYSVPCDVHANLARRYTDYCIFAATFMEKWRMMMMMMIFKIRKKKEERNDPTTTFNTNNQEEAMKKKNVNKNTQP